MKQLVWVALFAAGCHNVYLGDDEGAPRPAAGIGEHPDELSLPYALGTQIGFTAHNTGNASGWSVVSDSPGIFAIDSSTVQSDGTLTAQGHAAGEGDARLRVLDAAGREQRSSQVLVRAPVSARLYAHGQLRVLGNDSSANYANAEVGEASVLVGGTAVFAVAYFSGAARVYGRGIAAGLSTPMLTVEDHATSGMPTNEWLFVRPAAAGSYVVPVQAGAAVLASLPVTGVVESDLAGMALASESIANKHNGDEVWVLAQVKTNDGHQVFGVYTGWTLDGAPQIGKNNDATVTEGDLYRFKRGNPLRMLTATRGALSASTVVPADDGYVADTTYLGCAAAPGRPTGAPLGLALALALIACARRFGTL